MKRKLRINEANHFSRFGWLSEKYAIIIREWPGVVLAVIFAVASSLCGLAALHFSEHPPDWDPKTGFEARGTALSERRMAYHLIRNLPFHLKRSKLDDNKSSNEQLRDEGVYEYTRRYPRDADKAQGAVQGASDGKNQGTDIQGAESAPGAGADEWAKQLAQIYLSSPCIQLQHNQTVQAKAVTYLVKVVHRAESVETLFSLEAMLELCHLADDIDYSAWTSLIAYTSGFSLPSHLSCVAQSPQLPAYNCSFLTRQHVDELREKPCNQRLVADMFWYFLPNDIFGPVPNKTSSLRLHSGPLHVVTFLPPFTLAAYKRRVKKPPHLDAYMQLRRHVANYSAGMRHWRLVGMHTGTKLNEFDLQLASDVPLGVLSCGVVLLLVLLYTGSPTYTLAMALGLGYSIGLAYVLYTWVFGIELFGFMNLLVFVLLIGIGADDAFVLQHLVHAARVNARQSGAPPGTLQLLYERALSHAALSMLVTSATTSAAFFANAISNVVCIRLGGGGGVYSGFSV